MTKLLIKTIIFAALVFVNLAFSVHWFYEKRWDMMFFMAFAAFFAGMMSFGAFQKLRKEIARQ